MQCHHILGHDGTHSLPSLLSFLPYFPLGTFVVRSPVTPPPPFPCGLSLGDHPQGGSGRWDQKELRPPEFIMSNCLSQSCSKLLPTALNASTLPTMT